MDFLKELFGDGELSFDAFCKAVNEKGYKLADLATGKYVDKRKYEDEISAKDSAIEDLKGQIKTRNNDITDLKNKLASEGDNANKIADMTAQIEKLQGEYDLAKKDYEARIGKQSYEFAVKEFANEQKFTSNAAKKQFINEMVSENLKMKNGTIIGADDFMKVYKEANADSFVAESEPQPEPQPEPDKPTFVQPTAPTAPANDNPFANAFNFTGVRPHEQ